MPTTESSAHPLPPHPPLRLEDFRITGQPAIETWLRQLLDQQVPLQLSTPDGVSLSTRLWSLDAARATLSLEVPGTATQLQALQGTELLACAYLDNIRLEFELDAPVLVQSATAHTLHAPWPGELYRFQRRQAYRVQPLGSGYPAVLLQHPDWPGMPPLRLRVLDLSISGLALLLPGQAPMLAAGRRLNAQRLELDRDSHFLIDLRLQHAGPALDGLRLGCAFEQLPAGAERALQLYIDQTQKRQRLLMKKAPPPAP